MRPEPKAPADATSSPHPPRAFCHATGFIYQSVGFLMAISTCCWWSFTGLTQDELRPTEAGRQVVEVAKDSAPTQRWALAAVCVLFIGGLWLVALGMGLQNDRLRSGRPAKWTTGLATLFFVAYLEMSAFVWPASVARSVTTGVLAAIWGILFVLGGVSAEVLRRNPPTPRPSTWTPRDEDDLRKGLSPRSPDRTNP